MSLLVQKFPGIGAVEPPYANTFVVIGFAHSEIHRHFAVLIAVEADPVGSATAGSARMHRQIFVAMNVSDRRISRSVHRDFAHRGIRPKRAVAPTN